jgi:hypothetical protein
VVVGICCLDRLFTDRREVKVGNKPSCLFRVGTKEDIADANIPVINTELAEGMETLGWREFLVY